MNNVLRSATRARAKRIPRALQEEITCPCCQNFAQQRQTTITRQQSTSTASTSSHVSRPPILGRQTVQDATLPVFTDPLKLVGKELGIMRSSIQSLLGSRHPALDTMSKYYFSGAEAKHIRPMIVLLMSQATNGLAPQFDAIWQKAMQIEQQTTSNEIDDAYEGEAEHVRNVNTAINPESILNDVNPDAPTRSDPAIRNVNDTKGTYVLPSQRRLAEIIEMIHVASLLHDDVIDNATTRRAQPSAPAEFGNKLSILGGDFLLARASLYLSRLGSTEVVEVIASVLANLVEGEVMQMKGNTPSTATSSILSFLTTSTRSGPTPETFEHYMTKTYLKTASLMAKSARAAVVLGGNGIKQGWPPGEKYKLAAYSYGKNIGLAFQIVDDLLDFTSSESVLGKPGAGADLKLGLATAPALYAWEEFPEMGALIERKFEGPGDVEMAKSYVARSKGIEKSRELASQHARLAREAILEVFPDSNARTALVGLTEKVLSRSK